MVASTPHGDALWNLLGNLVYAGCQWLVLVATVKLLAPAQVGQLSLGFAVTAPIFLLLHLRLRAASATDANLAFTRSDYIVLRIACTALAVLLSWAVCAVAHFDHEQLRIVLWIAIAKTIESGSDLMYGLSQRAENLRAIALSMAARGLLSVVAFVFLLLRTHRLDVALVGLCAAWAAVFFLLDVPIGMRMSQTTDASSQGWTMQSIVRLAWLTAPLGLSTMFMSLSANMPRYFIEHSLGAGALGIFSAAGYLTMTGSVAISAIAESSIARMARLLAARQLAEATAILDRVRDVTLVLSGVLIAVSIVAGKQILLHIYRADYVSVRGLLVMMMVAATAANLASVYGYALIAARRFRAHLWSLILSTACTAIACVVAIPRWGAMGAAFACLVGYALQAAAARAWLRPALSHEVPAKAAPASASIALGS